MPDFTTIAKVGEIPEGKGKRFQVGERIVAVFHVEGKYTAMDDYCPHMGESLAHGDLHADKVICDRHLWAFKLDDGQCIDVPGLNAETFEVRVEGDEIQVRVPDES